MRAVVLFVMTAGMSISINAQVKNHPDQTTCKVRFAIYQLNRHIPGGIAPGMSKEQGRWYEKNKKKYAAACVDGERADYYVVWSSRFATEGTPETAINFAAITGYSGTSSAGASGYTVTSPVESEYVYLTIFRAADVQLAQKDKSYQPRPLFYTQHDSWWTYRKSHHKSMEEALKFLVQVADPKAS